MLPTLAAIFAFATIASFATWIIRRPAGEGEARLRSLADFRFSGMEGVSFRERVLLPTAHGLADRLTALLPPAFIARTSRKLIMAGRPMTVGAFFTVVFVMGGLGAALAFALIWAGTGGDPSPALFLLVPVFAGIGLLLPFMWLSRQVSARQTAVWKSLPDGFDLVTICVEAGLGLDAAFQRVSEKVSGPFAEEIRVMLREVAMGKPRREALMDMAARTGVPELRSFASAVIQAEQLGTSLASVLRVQAQQLRIRRRQKAEELARRAPVKMVFPLVLFLIPSLFIVILGPVAVNVIRAFEG